MNDKDKEAFKNWYTNKESEFDNCKEAWQAACEYKQVEISGLEAEKQKLFIKLSKELEAEKDKSSKLKEETDKLKDCVNFYAAGNVQFDHEYIAVQSGLVSKIGSYARKVLAKLENK